MPSFRLPKRRWLWVMGAVLFAVVLAIGVWLIGSPPPRTIILATGDPDGGFALLGREYKNRLERMGLKVELLESTGSIANLKALQDRKADVAFVQSGVTQRIESTEGLCSLAAIGSHPLWIFARSGSGKNSGKDATSLADLGGATVALGPAGSGTDAFGRLLLDEFHVKPAKIVNVPMKQSRQALETGDAQFAMLVCSAEAPAIRDLMARDDVHLVGLHRQAAIARRLPYVRKVDLLAGSYDLGRDQPAADVAMVAPVILLASREDLHPRVVEQLLLVSKKVQSNASLLEDSVTFPILETAELPAHVAAEKFMVSGESFLSWLLPYWGVRLVWQAQIILLPIITVLIPLWRIVPALQAYRLNRVLKRKYTALRDAENRIDACNDAPALRLALDRLDALRSELESLSRKLPADVQRDIYNWRLHVAMVRTEGEDRLKRMTTPPPAL